MPIHICTANRPLFKKHREIINRKVSNWAIIIAQKHNEEILLVPTMTDYHTMNDLETGGRYITTFITSKTDTDICTNRIIAVSIPGMEKANNLY